MKTLTENINAALLRIMLTLRSFVEEERGDTNFISIAIVLVVILGLAVVFINFGEGLLPELQQEIQELMDIFGDG